MAIQAQIESVSYILCHEAPMPESGFDLRYEQAELALLSSGIATSPTTSPCTPVFYIQSPRLQ